MSFSKEVKNELLSVKEGRRHCQRAEFAAILSGIGGVEMHDGKLQVRAAAEQELLMQKYCTLLEQVCGVCGEIKQKQNKNSWQVCIRQEEEVEKILQALKLIGNDGTIREKLNQTNGLLLQRSCCKRAYLRGAFLAAGSISDPKKSYHFEIVCGDIEKARQIQELLASFQLDAKTVFRKGHEIVYLKEGSQIVDALNVMGAHVALMDLENVRIIKEMRNDVNRRVNCETANIHKTVSAAYRQQEAIRFLQVRGMLTELPEQLQEIASLRMEYPEATIKELGAYCVPEVGKSGVNHRLRRLEEIAGRMGYQNTAHSLTQ